MLKKVVWGGTFFVLVCGGLLYWEFIGVDTKSACYAETPLNNVRLDGDCNIRSFGIGWQYRGEYMLIITPNGKTKGDVGYYFYYLTNRDNNLNVNWNADPLNDHAQAWIDSSFSIENGEGYQVCWKSEKALICFD